MFCQTRSLKVRKVFLEYHPDGLQGQPDLVYIQTGMMRFTPGNSFNEGTVLLGNNWCMPPAPPPAGGGQILPGDQPDDENPTSTNCCTERSYSISEERPV